MHILFINTISYINQLIGQICKIGVKKKLLFVLVHKYLMYTNVDKSQKIISIFLQKKKENNNNKFKILLLNKYKFLFQGI